MLSLYANVLKVIQKWVMLGFYKCTFPNWYQRVQKRLGYPWTSLKMWYYIFWSSIINTDRVLETCLCNKQKKGVILELSSLQLFVIKKEESRKWMNESQFLLLLTVPNSVRLYLSHFCLWIHTLFSQSLYI